MFIRRRKLVDNAIPNRDTSRLNWLALGMIGIPLVNALIGLGQRYLSAIIGEHLIADLRNTLFNHMQHMSLRFFTDQTIRYLLIRRLYWIMIRSSLWATFYDTTGKQNLQSDLSHF